MATQLPTSTLKYWAKCFQPKFLFDHSLFWVTAYISSCLPNFVFKFDWWNFLSSFSPFTYLLLQNKRLSDWNISCHLRRTQWTHGKKKILTFLDQVATNLSCELYARMAGTRICNILDVVMLFMFTWYLYLYRLSVSEQAVSEQSVPDWLKLEKLAFLRSKESKKFHTKIPIERLHHGMLFGLT